MRERVYECERYYFFAFYGRERERGEGEGKAILSAGKNLSSCLFDLFLRVVVCCVKSCYGLCAR